MERPIWGLPSGAWRTIAFPSVAWKSGNGGTGVSPVRSLPSPAATQKRPLRKSYVEQPPSAVRSSCSRSYRACRARRFIAAIGRLMVIYFHVLNLRWGNLIYFILVPKLLLGNLSGCEALLRSGNGAPHLGSAERSLAGNCVPKLGLEIRKWWHRRLACAVAALACGYPKETSAKVLCGTAALGCSLFM
jgi:hypothetical protein